MIEKIMQSGYIYEAETGLSGGEPIAFYSEGGVCIFPEAAFEDVGIGCHVIFKDELYQVVVYQPRRELKPEGFGDYLAGLGIQASGGSADGDVRFYTMGEDFANCASARIDEGHYYTVRTNAAKETLIDFLGELRFVRIYLLTP